MKKHIKIGDIFAIKIEESENYYFGRVLFDVQNQYDNLGQTNNYFDWYKESVLIETYKYISNELKINDYEIDSEDEQVEFFVESKEFGINSSSVSIIMIQEDGNWKILAIED